MFLQPLLVMADRLSMGNSLEVRNPFLDYRLVEFSLQLDDRLKYRDGQGKWLLRKALRRLVGAGSRHHTPQDQATACPRR